MKKALLFTGQQTENVSTLARNLVRVGGLSLFARQMKQMKTIGIGEMHIVTDRFAEEFAMEIESCTKRPEKVFIHKTEDIQTKLLEYNNEGTTWFLMEEGVILDERIIEQVAEHPSPTTISLIGQNDFPEEHTANGTPLQLANQKGYFGSIAKLSSQTLAAHISTISGLKGLSYTLKAVAKADDSTVIKTINIPLYIPNRRREVDLLWFPIIRREEGNTGTDMLLDNAQKGTLDWPAWFIHRPIENFIVKHICKFPVTPNQVTVATGILGFYIMYLFINGEMLSGLAGAYIVGILDGVDGKLARVKMLESKIGELEHLVDKVVEYGWYFAIAAYLSDTHGLVPYVMAISLVSFHLADEIQSEFFRRLTNLQICDTGSFDRKFRLIGGRRNTQFWALLPFALYDQWYAGFAFICAYGIVTFFVHQVRIVHYLKNMMIANSEIFAENFKKTKVL